MWTLFDAFLCFTQEGSLKSQRCVVDIKTNKVRWAVMCGSVAEWSKALVLGTSHFDGVGSNPTAAKFFSFLIGISCLNFFILPQASKFYWSTKPSCQ